jgi:hypothetical protein
VRLVFSQDRLQMPLADDQHAIQELATLWGSEIQFGRVTCFSITVWGKAAT